MQIPNGASWSRFLFIFPDCRWNEPEDWWRKWVKPPPGWSHRSSRDARLSAISRFYGASRIKHTR